MLILSDSQNTNIGSKIHAFLLKVSCRVNAWFDGRKQAFGRIGRKAMGLTFILAVV